MKVIVKQAGKPAEITEVDFKYRNEVGKLISDCLLYTSPSPRD